MSYEPIIDSQSALLATWQHLMQPLGFAGHSIWLLRIGPDRRAVPHLVEIADSEVLPSGEEAAGFAEVLRLLDAGEVGGSFGFLRSRPGPGVVRADDRAWAAFLYDAGRVAGVDVEVVHLATDESVVPLPLDEIGLSRTA
ncbi:MAG: hypothetical protein WBP61_19495 [Nocardioides sp.]